MVGAAIHAWADSKSKPRDWDRELTAADEDEDDDDDDGLYDAAYEGMTYRDTTDDGHEGAVFEFGDDGSHDELEAESKRLVDHLSFLQSLARMWAVAADIAVVDTIKNSADLDRLRIRCTVGQPSARKSNRIAGIARFGA